MNKDSDEYRKLMKELGPPPIDLNKRFAELVGLHCGHWDTIFDTGFCSTCNKMQEDVADFTADPRLVLREMMKRLGDYALFIEHLS